MPFNPLVRKSLRIWSPMHRFMLNKCRDSTCDKVTAKINDHETITDFSILQPKSCNVGGPYTIKLCIHHAFRSPGQVLPWSVQTRSSRNVEQHAVCAAQAGSQRRLPCTTKPISNHTPAFYHGTAQGCTLHMPPDLSAVDEQSPDCQWRCRHIAWHMCTPQWPSSPTTQIHWLL